jgi:RTX calcium-binding nonapeptide repeat (4 copies)
MGIHNIFRARQLSLAASVALAAGLATAGAAAAAPVPAPSASVANNTLTITGTGGGDSISLLFSGDPNVQIVDFGNGTLPQSFDRSTFNAIAVFLGGGDDAFTAQSGSTVPDDAVTVHGGAGNDTILGSDADERLLGDGGDDFIDGNRGNDTVMLGAGQDTAQWDPGDGSDLIDGGAGADKLTFDGANVAEKFALAANGSQAVLTRDVAAIRMDLDNVEQLDLETLGGADSVTVNDMKGTDIREANIDLAATGGAGDGSADTVTVIGTNKADHVAVAADGPVVDVSGLRADTRIAGAEITADALQVNTLGGNDTVAVSDDARALIGVGVDLGIGQP